MEKVKVLTADVTALNATIHQLERSIQVPALKNHDLRSVGAVQGKVVPLLAGGVSR